MGDHANFVDPPIKYFKDGRVSNASIEPKIRYRPETEPDPVAVAAKYVNHKWVQQLVPVRTECLVCHKESELVFLPIGTMAFGNLRMLRRGNSQHQDRDITEETVRAFAKIGWKFQLRRSYCPSCRGLGSV